MDGVNFDFDQLLALLTMDNNSQFFIFIKTKFLVSQIGHRHRLFTFLLEILNL